MSKNQDAEILKNMVEKDREFRLTISIKSFKYFCLFYFSSFFTYPVAEFHENFFSDCENIVVGNLNEVAWIAFRESAKTTIAKMFVCWCILFKKKRYINYDSYTKENAEQALFDIATWLQTNQAIVDDFGQYYSKLGRDKDENAPQMKRLSSFITKNIVKVEAFTTQESTRGRIFGAQRPDLFVLDDIETNKTKESIPTIEKIKSHIDEMKSGLSADGSVLYLGNLITEIGVVDYIMKAIVQNPKGVVRNIPVIENHVLNKAMDYYEGKVAWPEKYVLTDIEAKKFPDKKFVSLETKRKMLNVNGGKVFESEMLNDPPAAGALFFDRETIDVMISKLKPPVSSKNGARLHYSFNPAHRYALGADTSQGVGLDSNASVVIDFTQMPCRVVLCYDNNQIAPDTFSYVIKSQGEDFGNCLVAPEVNASSGGACLNELKRIYPIDKIYRRIPEGEVKDMPSKKLGWETNAATKPDMLFALKRAVEDGHLEIPDEKLLQELRGYSQADLENYSSETTRHFDLLIACAICWKMKDHAQAPATSKRNNVQPEYESPSFSSQ